MSANDDLRDSAIRHSIYLHRYGEGLADKVLKLLNSADKEIAAKIAAGVSTEIGERRFRELLAEIRTLSDEVYSKAFDEIEAGLTEQATATAEHETSAINRAVPPTFYRASLPSATKLATLATTSPIDGYLLKSWTDKMSENRTGRVEKALRTGMVQGETIDQLVRRVMGTKAKGYKDGVMEISRRSARSLVITANATIAAQAREETHKRNAEVIKQVMWVSTLDTRTSSICQSRDGQTWELDEAHPKTPAHIRCRSVLVPITKSAKELGLDKKDIDAKTRASMDGQVPAKTTYGDWLKKQSEARQDEILGKERADLFRTGKLPFKDLYKADGSFKSVADLRKALDLDDAPQKAAEGFSPINPATTDTSIKVAPRLATQKALTADLKKSAADTRHFQTKEYKGGSVKDYGKASFAKDFDDRTVSAIAAIHPELDAICDRFGVARIRGYKTIRGRGAAANMGDSVMGVNPATLNRYAASIGDGDIKGSLKEAVKDRDIALKKLDPLKEKIEALNLKRRKAVEDRDWPAYERLDDEIKPLLKAYERERGEYVRLATKAKTLEGSLNRKASTWKAGDGTKDRPFGSDAYFESGTDKIRSLLYHETGHNIHQLFGKKARRERGELFPLERDIYEIFNRKRFDREWLDRQPTKYGTTKPVEWFAESFSLYMMGRKDLVDGEFITLIERYLDAAGK